MASNWRTPTELLDLRRVGIIALDTETRDARLGADMGSGWPFRDGHLCGVSIAYRAESEIHGLYFPLRHPDTQNFAAEQVYQWLRDHIAADVRFVTQNGLYDWGWLRTEAGIKMPPSERLEEISALATMVDENRFKYSLDALCTWRGLPGKDTALLQQGIEALGLSQNKRKKLAPQNYLWQLPARYVGPYAEADAVSTLLLLADLAPILDRENTRTAYRLECDILPMVLEMRLRGIRIDLDAAEKARGLLLCKRDAALAELSEKLDYAVSMHEIQGRQWLIKTFDALKIKYPQTEKGNPSFTAGKTGWMAGHAHWLPSLIATANKYNKAVADFLQKLIDYAVKGRIHAEINPHRSEDNGTKSFRFSYSNPPLQQMPSRDEELAPLIRGVFLPEDGEVWLKPDCSQQEFRLAVHYASQHKLRGAAEAVARYREDPDTDFHNFAATLTGLDRGAAKTVNFAKIYGAGVKKFGVMVGKPLQEAQQIYAQYDRELPFLRRLSEIYVRRARSEGFISLYDGARRHFDRFAPGGKWQKGAGPCPLEEARARLKDPEHPWYGRGPLYRADTHTALNALIQGSAARHTKLWMRACWREGIVPLLQMHDCLDCSVNSLEQGELIARLGCEAVQLDVPMRVDLKFGRNWGDARHSWEELQSKPVVHPRKAASRINTGPQPVTQTERDEINAGLKREGIEPINWYTPPPDTPPWNNSGNSGNSGASNSGGGDGYAKNENDDYKRGETPRGTPTDRYVYQDAQGRPFMRVIRTSSKNFPTQHRQNGHWVNGWPQQASVIPYRLPELLAAPAAEPVWICEGEKDADNVAALGLIATTNPGGAKVFQPELTQWFKGKELAHIVEDNDDAGREHTRKIQAALRGIVPSIAVIAFPELPDKGDVSDWLEAGGNLKLLLARAEQARQRAENRRAYIATNLSTVKPRALRWIWHGHLARGGLELIAGPPEIGKSQIHCQYIACTTTGREWPNGMPGVIPCRVILLTAEDTIEDTLVPRLKAAAADLKLIEELKAIRRNNRDEMFLLGEDLDTLEQMIRDFGDVGLVTIDPITAYMGHAKHFDSHRATDVRSQLSPLKKLAEQTGVAFSAITHPPKNASPRALDHFIGSQAFIAAARIGHLCVAEMEEGENGAKRQTGRYFFTNPKINIEARQPTLVYRIDVVDIGFDEDSGVAIKAPVVRWEGESEITAEEALAAAKPTKTSKGQTAKDFLADILISGPVLQKVIIERGAERGFSYKQLWTAKDALGIEDFKEKGVQQGPSYWALPQHVPAQE